MPGHARSPGDQGALEALRRHVEESAFHAWAGFELVSVEVGVVEVALEVAPHHLNPAGILHGGMIATLADTAIGLAIRSALPPDQTHRTAQLNVHFLSKVEGGRVRALGRTVRVGGRMAYGEGDVVDEEGELVARASGTFIVLPHA